MPSANLNDRGETAALGSPGRFRVALFLAIFLLALIPVLSTPILPTIDMYDHLARYFVLAHLDSVPFLRANYESGWAVLPNIGLDIIGCGLMKIIDPRYVPHIIVMGVFATQYFGILFFNRQLTGRASLLVAVLTAPLLYSFIFTWGFANFLLGLGLVFWGGGAWLALRNRPLAATLVGCGLAVLIFLTHGVAFALYGLLLGAIEIGFFLSTSPRQPARLLRNLGLLALQAVVPIALFVLSATSKSADGLTNADESVRRLAHKGQLLARLERLMTYRLETIFRVAETPSPWFDAVSFATAGALLLLLLWRGRVGLARALWPAIALAILLVLIVPPTLFGVGYVADRMPLYLAFIVVGALTQRRANDRLDLVCIAALVALVAVRTAYIGVEWQRYRGDATAFAKAADAIPKGSLVTFVHAENTRRLDPGPRCEMYGPLLVLAHGQAAPLFAFGSQQPIRLTGGLKAAAAGLPSTNLETRTGAFLNDRLDLLVQQHRFDYVVICDAEHLVRPLPAAGEVVARIGRFTVLHTTQQAVRPG